MRVHALAFAVATAIVLQALVHVYTNKCAHMCFAVPKLIVNIERTTLVHIHARKNQITTMQLCTQTFALCRAIVRPTNWAIAAFMTAHCVRALAFAVATAVVFHALVHV